MQTVYGHAIANIDKRYSGAIACMRNLGISPEVVIARLVRLARLKRYAMRRLHESRLTAIIANDNRTRQG